MKRFNSSDKALDINLGGVVRVGVSKETWECDKDDFLKPIFRSALVITGTYLCGKVFYRFWEKPKTQRNQIELEVLRSRNKMKEADQKNQYEIFNAILKKSITKSNTCPMGICEDVDVPQDVESPEEEFVSWTTFFDTKFPKDKLVPPPIINVFCNNCPEGFEAAVIAQLAAQLATCFSKVEAEFLDGKFHRPNLQVIVEAASGSGKGFLKGMNDCLFSRRIERDQIKLSTPDTEKKQIIQSLSASTTASRLIDIIANNEGVHSVIFDPEIRTMCAAMKKNNNGLSYDLLRKAYDNDPIERINKDKNAPQGFFTVALNIVLTGTPGDADAFIGNGKEIEGGNATRIAWCTIPSAGKELQTFPMPEGAILTELQDKIDEWTAQYSFYIDQDGNEVPVDKIHIDLSYVNEKLRLWLNNQYDLADSTSPVDYARIDARKRIASMAFHCAIVFHMLYGNPGSMNRKERDNIVRLTLYMANYFMERYLHKFGRTQNIIRHKITAEEMVSVSRHMLQRQESPLLPIDAYEKGKLLYEEHDQGASYKELGEKYGVSEDAVKGVVKRYRDKFAAPETID